MPLPMQQPVKNWEMMNSTEISCKMTKGCEILPKKNFALEKKFVKLNRIYCFSLISFRLVVTAWKPDLMVCTEVLDWHNIHCKKNKRPSLAKMVSGDLQV